VSRIFEAIRKAQQDRERRAQAESAPVPGPRSDRRRSTRWAVHVPVFVYGYSAAQEPFHEEAQTLDVSANGTLLTLASTVQTGQHLLLIDRATDARQECRVVRVGAFGAFGGFGTPSTEVAIEFSQSNAPFWQLPAR
jgi:hypothetical protein